MPDLTLKINNLKGGEDAERLGRALSRMSFVELVNVDEEKRLAAVSYDGGGAELREIEAVVEEAGFEYEETPGASRLEE